MRTVLRMSASRHPRVLTIVAWLFVAVGISGVLSMIASFAVGQPRLDWDVLELWLGGALLAHQPWSWKWARALLGLEIAVGVLVISMAILFSASAELRWGPWHGPANPSLITVVAMALLALSLWQYRVLGRPDVRRLFGVAPTSGHSTH